MKSLLFATIALLFAPTAASAADLVTPLDADNSQRGIMFDVNVGSQDVVFENLATLIQGTAPGFEFYTITGGIGANASNAAAWTLRDTFPGLTGSTPALDTFDFTDFIGQANTTVGFYFTVNTPNTGNDPWVQYHTSTNSFGDTRSSDGNISILTGYGKDYPFGTTYAPRDFVGSIGYSVGGAVPEPATWALMLLGFGFVGGAMRIAKRRQKIAVSYA